MVNGQPYKVKRLLHAAMGYLASLENDFDLRVRVQSTRRMKLKRFKKYD